MPFGKLSFKAKAGNQTTQKRNNGRKWLHNLRCRNQLRRVLLATTTTTTMTTMTTTMTLTPVVRWVSQPTTSNNFQRRFFPIEDEFSYRLLDETNTRSLFISLSPSLSETLSRYLNTLLHTHIIPISLPSHKHTCLLFLSLYFLYAITHSFYVSLSNKRCLSLTLALSFYHFFSV